MFLFHPRVAQRLNAKSIYTPFAPDGLSGPTGEILRAQQANRLLAFGQQSLASSGGAASLCGGAAGPGGGPAGAAGAPGSGSSAVTSGGSNGAGGGVPSGNQELGRYAKVGSTIKSGPVIVDDLVEIVPQLPSSSSALLSRSAAEDAANTISSGLSSVGGVGQNDMTAVLANSRQKPKPAPKGPPTCPAEPTSKSK